MYEFLTSSDIESEDTTKEKEKENDDFRCVYLFTSFSSTGG